FASSTPFPRSRRRRAHWWGTSWRRLSARTGPPGGWGRMDRATRSRAPATRARQFHRDRRSVRPRWHDDGVLSRSERAAGARAGRRPITREEATMSARTTLMFIAAVALLASGAIGQEQPAPRGQVIAGRSRIATK